MNLQEIVITIVIGAISVAVSFYLKDFLLQKQQFRKLRAKLEKIAGKNATVIYEKDEVFKLKEIDESGVILENEMKTIFVPTDMLLQTQMILPSDRYTELKKEKELEKETRMAKIILEEMKNVFPSMLLEPMQEDSKETREALKEVLSKLGEKADPTELMSLLMQAGAIQPPDPTQVIASRLAKLLTSSTDVVEIKSKKS